MKAHQHLWVLDVLRPQGQRVLALGDHNLAYAVSTFGFRTMAATDPDPCDVLLLSDSLDVGCHPDGRLLRPEASVVAVVFPASSRIIDFGLPGRAAAIASAPLVERGIASRLDEARTRLEAMGYRCRTMRIGNGFGPYELAPGTGTTADLRDRPSGSVLVGHRPTDDPVANCADWSARVNGVGRPAESSAAIDTMSVIGAVTDEVAERLGRRLTIQRVMAMPSQKLQVYASAPGPSDEYVIAVGVSTSVRLLERSLAARRLLRDCDIPVETRDRIVWPVADGVIEPARFVVEPLARGTQVSKSTSDTVRVGCIDFLRDLFVAGADGAKAEDDAFANRLESWCRHISLFLEPPRWRGCHSSSSWSARGARCAAGVHPR